MSRRPAILLLALLSTTVLADNDPGFQDLDSIRAAAEQFLKAQPHDAGVSTEIQASTLDPRLHLPRCETHLQAFQPAGARSVGNTTVGVRCSGGSPWSIYVPVHVSASAEVMIVNRPVARGATLTAADLRSERRDLAALSYGYVLHAEQAAGQRVTRSLSEGAVLTPNSLAPPQWVKRGEHVTLLAQTSGMEIRMAGEALMDGTEGAVVRVRNDNSARIVEGTVIAEGVIQVRL
jgi:flagellar basal body P-ring formation protein FlgA